MVIPGILEASQGFFNEKINNTRQASLKDSLAAIIDLPLQSGAAQDVLLPGVKDKMVPPSPLHACLKTHC